MTKAEIKLQILLQKKQRIQEVEEEQEENKKMWKAYGGKVRSTAQKLYAMREALFNSI